MTIPQTSSDKISAAFRPTPQGTYENATSFAICGPDGNPLSLSFSGNLNAVQQASNSFTNEIPVNTSSIILLNSNTSRKLFYLVNKSSISTLYFQFGTDASLTNFLSFIGPNMGWVSDLPVYYGTIYGIWDTDDPSGKCLATDIF